MAQISRNKVEKFIRKTTGGRTAAEQGTALEDLICYIFTQVPGIAVSKRNTLSSKKSEEIDIALWNDAPTDGFFFLPHLVLVECKNWSNPVGSSEVSWFDNKLRSRGLDLGFLMAMNGITGSKTELTAAQQIVSGALREGRRLIVIGHKELVSLTHSSELVHLVKEKLCNLTVTGCAI